MTIQISKRNKGFVGMVFLAIALIGIVIAAIAAMSRSSSSGTADQANKSNASILIKQASDFKNGIDRMIVGGVAASSITFDSAVNTGLFDPTPGAQFAVKHVPPASIFIFVPLGGPVFNLNKAVKLPGIGSSAADYVVTAGPIQLAVCQQINKILYNDSVTASPATSTGTPTDWNSSPVDDGAQTSATNYNARPEGCVQTSIPGWGMYYKAVVEN
jgi:hypothetical protein